MYHFRANEIELVMNINDVPRFAQQCEISGDLANSVVSIAEAIKHKSGKVPRDEVANAIHAALLREKEVAREQLIQLKSSIDDKTKEGFEAASVFFLRGVEIDDTVKGIKTTVRRLKAGLDESQEQYTSSCSASSCTDQFSQL
jgi:hypothetical protein